jgi:S1 RNA binding domain protein
MEFGVGSIIEGKVTGITKFGAFVSLEGNKSGLVHISEIANSYVNDIHDYLKEGQDVKVKVIAIDENGRRNLSIKRTLPPPQQGFQRGERQERSGGGEGGGRPPYRSGAPRSGGRFSPRPQAAREAPPAPDDFEAKLKQFMAVSDSKISDLNHYMDKRGGGRRRK